MFPLNRIVGWCNVALKARAAKTKGSSELLAACEPLEGRTLLATVYYFEGVHYPTDPNVTGNWSPQTQ